MVIPKTSGGVRITVNYKKLNKVSSLSQLPIPRVDQVLEYSGKERVFLLFDLVSLFYWITAHRYTAPFTAFFTPTGLYDGPSCSREAVLHPGGSSRLDNNATA